MNQPYLAIVSLAVSVLVAAWNVYDRLVTRSHDRKSKAPYLMTEQFIIAWIPDTSEMEVSLTIKNCGVSPARDLRGEIIMLLDMKEKPYRDTLRATIPKLRFENVNGLPGGLSHTETFRICLPAYIPPQAIKVGIECVNPFTGERFRPSFYYKWGGLEDGVQRFAMKPLASEECKQMEAYLATPNLVIP